MGDQDKITKKSGNKKNESTAKRTARPPVLITHIKLHFARPNLRPLSILTSHFLALLFVCARNENYFTRAIAIVNNNDAVGEVFRYFTGGGIFSSF